MKNQTCCFTGYKKIPPGQYKRITGRLREEIIDLIKGGIIFFGAGGALGFDTLAALTVLSLREQYPQVKLILVLPCRNQDKCWSEGEKKIYNHILESADKVVYLSEHYHKGCMHVRNQHLVNNSSICICYLTGKSGGTAYTVNYATRKGLKIINLA